MFLFIFCSNFDKADKDSKSKFNTDSSKNIDKEFIFFSKYPNCSRMSIHQKIYNHKIDTLDTAYNSLKKFYSKYPEICGREIVAMLYINPECEIFGYKIYTFNPSNHCQTDEDYIIIPEIEKEYKSAFEDWLNGLVEKNARKECKDTLFFVYGNRIGDR